METKNTITSSVKSRINNFNEGYVFSYSEFEGAAENAHAIIKALNRFASKGIIHKLIKGKYYKSNTKDKRKKGPDKDEVIKDLLVKNILPPNKDKVILIGRNTFKPPIKRGIYTIKFLFQKHVITQENTEMLKVLDCLKLIKGISVDARRDFLKSIAKVIRKFNKKERELLIKLSLKYPSSTRDLLMYVFEQEKINAPFALLEEYRNPISDFNTGLKEIDKFLKDKYKS